MTSDLGLKKFIIYIKIRTGIAKCADYAELMQSLVDNEASPQDEVLVREHLDMCLHCLDHLNLDIELKKVLREKLQYHQVPLGLADSIKSNIAKIA